jgi:hypothetical protein
MQIGSLDMRYWLLNDGHTYLFASWIFAHFAPSHFPIVFRNASARRSEVDDDILDSAAN